MEDSRLYVIKYINRKVKFSIKHSVTKFLLSLFVAYFVAIYTTYDNLSYEASMMLFILIFASLLWISEAIPAFAVAFLIIFLEIVLLGFDKFDFSTNSNNWQYYLKPWASPLIFLFLSGFILAIAASKTKLDLWLAKWVLFYVGSKPKNLLTGLMLITFVLSMFVSNTATIAMMMTILLPILKNMKDGNPFQKGMLVGIVFASNIGGMGTIIGTPPNAIAIGILGDNAPSFIEWMIFALPPAVLLSIIFRWFILKYYPSNEEKIDIDRIKKVSHYDDSTTHFTTIPTVPSWKKILVITVFTITILLWITGPIHNIPVTVVSLLPIVIFTIFGIINSDNIQEIRWDVIILIIGGLNLGLGVTSTGLDKWIGSQFDLVGISILVIACIFALFVISISNFMSNTAATNIILPLVVALSASMGDNIVSFMVISVALCSSCAMMLPVSTPPNAIAYSSGKLSQKDFLFLGIFSAIVGPILILGFMSLYI